MIGPDQESVRQRAVTGDLFADPLTDSPLADSAHAFTSPGCWA